MAFITIQFYFDMKHIMLFFSFVALLGCTVSCGSDENLEVPAPAVEVLKAETFFPVLGGEKQVVVAQTPAQAYALNDWLKVTKSDKTIKLSTSFNNTPQSRNTLLVLKNDKGDSTNINVMQEGVNFGLPQEKAYYGGDESYKTTIPVTANVEVKYSSTADWLSVVHEGDQLKVQAEVNKTRRARVAYVKAEALGLQDSIVFVQASINDVAGKYTQHALRLKDSVMVETTNEVEIVPITSAKAHFIIDKIYKWEIDFTPGKGFVLSNGKILREEKDPQKGTPIYIETALAVDNFNYKSQTYIMGTRDLLDLRVGANGELHFQQHEKLDDTRNWASYLLARFSTKTPDRGSFQGILTEFIQPRLVRK